MTAIHPEQTNEHTHDHHDHDHDRHHDHHHDHDHDHPHEHSHSLWANIASALHLPGYSHQHERLNVQQQTEAEQKLAIRTVWLALLALGITTAIQVVIVVASGSVALLADTVHNLGDALNSIPLLIAFYLARRAANRRYTYGYDRAEDVAGIFIVLSIGFSATYILWESIQKLLNPQPLQNLGWIAAAAVVGFIGNELVALMQIRVGRQIGSEAMIADGLHARTDGLTSLAVLIAVVGTLLGAPILDPIIGILIGITIVFITRDAALAIWYRLMDAVDPKLVEKTQARITEHVEINAIRRLQMRWVGRKLHVELSLETKDNLNAAQAEDLRHHLSHHLEHDLPHLGGTTIELVPAAA